MYTKFVATVYDQIGIGHDAIAFYNDATCHMTFNSHSSIHSSPIRTITNCNLIVHSL